MSRVLSTASCAVVSLAAVRSRTALRFLVAFALAAVCAGCAPDFDPGSQVEGALRVFAVHKDEPYARPGDDVHLTMLWYDGSGKPGRKIQIAWLAGCYNPRGDIYSLCFQDSSFESLSGFDDADAGVKDEAGTSATVGDAGEEADGGPDAAAPSDADAGNSGAPELSIPSAGASFGDPDFPVKIGYGEDFTLHVPNKIISSRPPPDDEEVPRYGLAYVFFAVCAGEIRAAPGESFPLACYDGKRRLSSTDFVAGYTAVYAYQDAKITNANPTLSGLMLDGKPLEYDCLGTQCSGVIPPASNAPGECSATATVKRCADSKGCHKPSLMPIIDQSKPAENDAVLSEIRGQDFSEQMWINYYVDRGEVKNQARLLNDAVLGWNKDYGTELSPTEAGTAYVWAVVHDNRGGVNWVRARVCVTP